MLKAYKYRIYPNKEQKEFLQQSFGCARYIFNKALEANIQHYQETQKFIFYNELATGLLKQEKAEHDWLKQPYSQVLQSSLRHLEDAMKKCFKEGAGFPNFKKRNNRQSISYPQHVKVDFKANKIKIPKCPGEVFAVLHQKFEGKIKTVTISKTPANKYFASVLVDNNEELPEKEDFSEFTTVGIDLGLKHFITDSNGIKVENPKYLDKTIEKLKVLKQEFSRTEKGSNNREKARLKVAKCYEKIRNQRHDFLHKLSYSIIRDNQAVIVEDLSVADMIERGYRDLSRNISDASWSTFVKYVEYKAEWYGKTLIKIDRYDPSSKRCSECGNIKSDLELKDREWTCESCNSHHDRDENAAINVKYFGLAKLVQNTTAGTVGSACFKAGRSSSL